MDETTIDRDAMGKLAQALAFICGAEHPTTVALKTAAESGLGARHQDRAHSFPAPEAKRPPRRPHHAAGLSCDPLTQC